MTHETLCDKCTHRSICSSLCPEALMYAEQDYVHQREVVIGLPIMRPYPSGVSNTYLTKREQSIVTLLGMGLTRKDICQLLSMSNGSLRIAILRIRKKL